MISYFILVLNALAQLRTKENWQLYLIFAKKRRLIPNWSKLRFTVHVSVFLEFGFFIFLWDLRRNNYTVYGSAFFLYNLYILREEEYKNFTRAQRPEYNSHGRIFELTSRWTYFSFLKYILYKFKANFKHQSGNGFRLFAFVTKVVMLWWCYLCCQLQ